MTFGLCVGVMKGVDMKQRLKPQLDMEALQDDLIIAAVEEYGYTKSIKKAAKNMGISPMKCRKLLITAGEYSCDTADEVQRMAATTNPKTKKPYTVAEIAERMGMSGAAVSSYLPYKRTAYNLPDRTVDADRAARSRERKLAKVRLTEAIERDEDWTGLEGFLWEVVRLYQGVTFKTTGRGKDHIGSVRFQYILKISSRSGLETDELVFSNRENGKTITRSTVELALKRALAVQAECGCVTGPRKLGDLFGKSQLYAMFLRWGLITAS